MNNKENAFVLIMITLFLVIVFSIIDIFHTPHHEPQQTTAFPNPDPNERIVIKSEKGMIETRYDEGSIYTILHDKHMLIINSKGGVMHHPDCPCLHETAHPVTPAK